jgi:arginase
VLWFDAHGDLNTVESSPSGNEWATPLRRLIDSGAVGAEDVALVGARNLDPPEEEFIASNGIGVGPAAVPRALADTGGTYVAIDFDSLAADEVSAFMPEPDGLAVDEVESLLETVRDEKPVLGAGFTALLPDESNVPPLARLGSALGF